MSNFKILGVAKAFLPTPMAANIENLSPLLHNNLVVPRWASSVLQVFPHIAWQAQRQVVHKKYNLYKIDLLVLWATKSQWSQIFLPFWKFLKCPQTKFHAHTMRESQVIRSKKSKFIIRSKFSWSSFFSSSILYWNYNNRYWYALQV